MKLRNKLIPLMSVLTATTCVAPIATSCGANLSDAGMVDITKNYIPTIAKAAKVTEATSDVDAQDLYFQHLAENPEILAQDVYKYQADYLPKRISYIEHYNPSTGTSYLTGNQYFIAKNVTAKVGVSNISFRKVNYVEKSGTETVDKSFYALSCDLKYHFTFSALEIEKSQYELDADLNFEASLHDIPTTVYAEARYNPTATSELDKKYKVWKLSNEFTKSKLLDAVPGWSYSMNRTDAITTTTVDEFGQKQSKTTSYSRNGVISRKEQIVDLLAADDESAYYDEFLNFDSYHLSDVTTTGVNSNFDLILTDGAVTGTIKSVSDTGTGVGTSMLPTWKITNDLFTIDNEGKQAIENNTITYFSFNLSGSLPETYQELMDAMSSPIAGLFKVIYNESDNNHNNIEYKYQDEDTSIVNSYFDWQHNLYKNPNYGYDFTISTDNKISPTDWYVDTNSQPNADYPSSSETIASCNSWSSSTKFKFNFLQEGTQIGYYTYTAGDASSYKVDYIKVDQDIPLVITIA